MATVMLTACKESKSGAELGMEVAAEACQYSDIACLAVLHKVSKNVFTKYKGNALSSEEFADFINKNGIDEFYITRADAIAIACVKLTCYNLIKINALSYCITSYDKKQIDEMLHYYEKNE